MIYLYVFSLSVSWLHDLHGECCFAVWHTNKMMIFSVYLSLILWFHVFISQYKSRCSLLLAVKILVDSYKPRCRLHIPSLSDSLVFGTSSIFKAVKSLIEQQSCIYTASAENQCVPHAAYWQQLDPGLKSNQTPVWLQYLPIELCISATKKPPGNSP